MKLVTKKYLSLVSMVAFALVGYQAHAATEITLCKKGKLERKIEVQSEGEGKGCKADYTKEGQTKTIYNAKNEAGFCSKKVGEFLENKFNSKDGWECSKDGAAVETKAQAKAEAKAEEKADVKPAATPAAKTEKH